jgi:hypothetical protein
MLKPSKKYAGKGAVAFAANFRHLSFIFRGPDNFIQGFATKGGAMPLDYSEPHSTVTRDKYSYTGYLE